MPDWLVSGFSLVGLIIAVGQQIPGIIWAIHPPEDDPFARNSGSPAVEVLEKTFGVSSLVLLVIVFSSFRVPSLVATLAVAGAFIVLGAYYVLYVLYYLGWNGFSVLVGMAAFPPLCFVLAALYQGNLPGMLTVTIFAFVHIGLTWSNFAPGRGK